MVERIQSIIKCDRKQMPSCSGSLSEGTKWSKCSSEVRKKDLLLQRYPTGAQLMEDTASTESHLSSISKELVKAKPQDSILLSLMKSTCTYSSHQLFILNDASSAKCSLEEYPALQHQVMVRIGAVLCVTSNCPYLLYLDTTRSWLNHWQ